MNPSETDLPSNIKANLDFLWMELTNRCNLRCTHCYSRSGPNEIDVAPLMLSEQLTVLTESYQIGCKKIQFIGGEPTLNENLTHLIEAAHWMGYELIEVYTNLIHLPNRLLHCFMENEVCIATSIYSKSEHTHDLITKTPGSLRRTIANLQKAMSHGLKVRASIVEMTENAGEAGSTAQFLKSEVGVEDVKIDRMRPFGRGGEVETGGMGDLCGTCAGGTLCITPDGLVAPCIMSKKWSVGSIRKQPLAEIVRSEQLAITRREIRNAVKRSQLKYMDFEQSGEMATNCAPNVTCLPNGCSPVVGCPPYNKKSLSRGRP